MIVNEDQVRRVFIHIYSYLFHVIPLVIDDCMQLPQPVDFTMSQCLLPSSIPLVSQFFAAYFLWSTQCWVNAPHLHGWAHRPQEPNRTEQNMHLQNPADRCAASKKVCRGPLQVWFLVSDRQQNWGMRLLSGSMLGTIWKSCLRSASSEEKQHIFVVKYESLGTYDTHCDK